MKTLQKHITEALINESDYINAGRTADKQFDTIKSYCSKKMYRKWKKSRTTSGDSADLYFIAKDLIDTIGYVGNDLDCIRLNVEKTNAKYYFRMTFMHEDWNKGDMKAWVYCDRSYPFDSAKDLPEFVDNIVAEVFKDIDTFKTYVDENGKTE